MSIPKKAKVSQTDETNKALESFQETLHQLLQQREAGKGINTDSVGKAVHILNQTLFFFDTECSAATSTL